MAKIVKSERQAAVKDAAICPKCGKPYQEFPALSRIDNETLICPDCGVREALEAAGVGALEQEKILDAVHQGWHGISRP